MKYRKKPVVIEAFKYDGDLMNSSGEYYVPEWAVEAYLNGTIYYDSIDDVSPPSELFVKTLEGVHHVTVGDYVIQGVKGELYPCKSDIFNMTYEPEMCCESECTSCELGDEENKPCQFSDKPTKEQTLAYKKHLLKEICDWYWYNLSIKDDGKVVIDNGTEYGLNIVDKRIDDGHFEYKNVDYALIDFVDTMKESNSTIFKERNNDEYNTWSKEEIDFIESLKNVGGNINE